jgi:hypothetical protein
VIVFAASLVGSLAILWFASGQAIGAIGSFLSGSAEIVSGYSSGMRQDFGVEEREYDYLLAPVLVLVAGAIAWISARVLPRLRRAVVMVMVAVFAFTTAKGGFVTHDVIHMATFYASLLGACIAFPLPSRARLRIGALVATVGAAAAAFTTAIPGFPLTNLLENARNGVETVATLADGDRLRAEIAQNRAGLAASYGIDPPTLALLEGRSVHVDPSEAGAAWTYRLDWHPLPVFQSFMAWTEELDERNADAVASADGPAVILRQNLNAIGRYPGFESPAAMIQMLCHFEALRTTPDWQVLGRVANRCGEARPLGSAEGTYGEPLAVPTAPPGRAVVARVHGVQVEGLERVRSALYRARSRQVTFDTDERLFTFVPATAADGLLLRAPASVDPPGPFKLAPDANEISFLLGREPADGPIEIDFYSLAVRP